MIRISDGSLTIRSLQDTPVDVTVMASWLSDPRVLEFYEGRNRPHDEAMVRHVFLEEMPAGNEHPCLIELEGQPVGYVQFYRLDDATLRGYDFRPDENVYGADQFIGLPDLWGKGVGTRMLRLLLTHLFTVEQADAVVVDPATTNTRAIRAYEKCGFRKHKQLPAAAVHEGETIDLWLMVARPQL